mmetsp:Transcript_80578/g.228260  ORF Transcript_80578/g.228260 Transcript_80578/m.228260 type:complete len:458 (+) Transcript_80578:65-1438(+)
MRQCQPRPVHMPASGSLCRRANDRRASVPRTIRGPAQPTGEVENVYGQEGYNSGLRFESSRTSMHEGLQHLRPVIAHLLDADHKYHLLQRRILKLRLLQHLPHYLRDHLVRVLEGPAPHRGQVQVRDLFGARPRYQGPHLLPHHLRDVQPRVLLLVPLGQLLLLARPAFRRHLLTFAPPLVEHIGPREPGLLHRCAQGPLFFGGHAPQVRHRDREHDYFRRGAAVVGPLHRDALPGAQLQGRRLGRGPPEPDRRRHHQLPTVQRLGVHVVADDSHLALLHFLDGVVLQEQVGVVEEGLLAVEEHHALRAVEDGVAPSQQGAARLPLAGDVHQPHLHVLRGADLSVVGHLEHVAAGDKHLEGHGRGLGDGGVPAGADDPDVPGEGPRPGAAARGAVEQVLQVLPGVGGEHVPVVLRDRGLPLLRAHALPLLLLVRYLLQQVVVEDLAHPVRAGGAHGL